MTRGTRMVNYTFPIEVLRLPSGEELRQMQCETDGFLAQEDSLPDGWVLEDLNLQTSGPSGPSITPY